VVKTKTKVERVTKTKTAVLIDCRRSRDRFPNVVVTQTFQKPTTIVQTVHVVSPTLFVQGCASNAIVLETIRETETVRVTDTAAVTDTAVVIDTAAVTDTAAITYTTAVTDTAAVTGSTDISVSSVGSYRLCLSSHVGYCLGHQHHCSSCCYRGSAGIVDPRVIQSGLALDGQQVPVAGQVPSLTSKNNFINFFLTQNVPLTEGKQVRAGSCNVVPMGHIIAKANLPSSKFGFSKNFGTVPADQPFTIEMKVKNMQVRTSMRPGRCPAY
jgi:hypothetical protein